MSAFYYVRLSIPCFAFIKPCWLVHLGKTVPGEYRISLMRTHWDIAQAPMGVLKKPEGIIWGPSSRFPQLILAALQVPVGLLVKQKLGSSGSLWNPHVDLIHLIRPDGTALMGYNLQSIPNHSLNHPSIIIKCFFISVPSGIWLNMWSSCRTCERQSVTPKRNAVFGDPRYLHLRWRLRNFWVSFLLFFKCVAIEA